jgi:transcriptional regulator with XRE-family HTH domain
MDKNEMNNFSKNLKVLREKKGYTQQDIADLLSKFDIRITATAVSYWEKNREPKYDVLLALGKIFDVSTDELLGNDFDSNNEISKMNRIRNQIAINNIKKNIEKNLDVFEEFTNLIKAEFEELNRLGAEEEVLEYRNMLLNYIN